MDDRTVFVRTAKGEEEARGDTSLLFGDAKRAFILVDGRESVEDLRKHAAPSLRAVLEDTLQQLAKDGFIRERDEKPAARVGSAPAPKMAMAMPKMSAPKMATPATSEASDEDLDFTSGQRVPVSAPVPGKAPAPAPAPATSDLDFSSLIPASAPAEQKPPAKPAEQKLPAKPAEQKLPAKPTEQKPPAKAAQEIDFSSIFASASASGQDKGAGEAEAKARAEAEAKARAETQARMKADAAANAKARAEAQARLVAKAEEKAQFQERQKVAAETEAKLKAEAETRARAAALVRADEKAREEEKAQSGVEEQMRAVLEARAKAEADARMRAEAKARVDAEAKARAEAEAKLKAETEARAREEARARAEAEAKARAEFEAKMKAAAEAKAQAEARARAEAEARARAEMEARLKAEAEARARAEALARADAEAKARARAAELAQGRGLDVLKADLAGLAEPEKKPEKLQPFSIDLSGFGASTQSPAAAQPMPDAAEAARDKARQEAEARRRAEQAADAARVRAQQEAEAARARAEQEAARMKAEEESRKLAEAQLKAFEEAERRAREQAEARAMAQARAQADAKDLAKQARIDARSAKRSEKIRRQAQRRPASGARILVTAVVIAVAAIVALPYFWPMQDYVARTEHELSEQLKQPVHIGAMSAASLPLPKVVLHDVTVGDSRELTIGDVSLQFNVLTLLADDKAIDKAELDKVTINAESFNKVLPWLAAGGSDPHYPVKHIVVRGARVSGDVPVLPAFNGEMAFNPQGAFTRAQLASEDGKAALTLQPQQGRLQVELNLKDSALPLAPAITFKSFGATGEVRDNGINFTNVDGILYGGTLKGTAYLSWQGGWSLQGRMSVSAIDVEKALPGLKISGEMSGDATLAMRSNRLMQLASVPHLEGAVQMREGTINSLDIGETVRAGSKQPAPGATHFDKLSAALLVDGSTQRLKQIRFTTGVMPVSGSVDVVSGNLSGQLQVDMTRVRAGMGTVPLTLGGAVSDMTWRGGR